MTATFGHTLTAAREQRGLSLEDAAHETRIPVQRLRYLETGNFAAFGSMTYARSFIRQYSDFLAVDASAILEELPEGALGGERDYRYLTQSHGAWLRDRSASTERVTAPATNKLHAIKSPLPAALLVFVLILAGAAMWGKHMAETQRQVEPAALKALPVAEDEPEVVVAKPAAQVAAKPAQTEPIFVRKAERID
jgi:cytoskeletal protein RodZ